MVGAICPIAALQLHGRPAHEQQEDHGHWIVDLLAVGLEHDRQKGTSLLSPDYDPFGLELGYQQVQQATNGICQRTRIAFLPRLEEPLPLKERDLARADFEVCQP
jgi:hypothetical protein